VSEGVAEHAQRGRRIPAWLAILAVLLSLGAGGYLLWRLWLGESPEGAIVGQGDPPDQYYAARRAEQRAQAPRGPRWARGDDVVTDIGQNNWGIKGGDAAVEIRKEPDGKLDLRFFYVRGEVMDQDDLNTLVARRRLAADQAMADSLKLTPEQVEKLKNIAGAPGMVVGEPDRTKLLESWDAYQKTSTEDAAAREDARTKLIVLVTEIGQKSAGPTRDTAKKRADEVRAILTAEQIKSVQ